MTPGDLAAELNIRFGYIAGTLPPATLFVNDENVDYSSAEKIVVRSSDLFDLTPSARWGELLQRGAGWIHFNLLKVDDDSVVVTVRRGPNSGITHADPVINVSAEPRPAAIDA